MKKQPKKRELSAVDLGTRYKCYECGTKFYDLGRLIYPRFCVWVYP